MTNWRDVRAVACENVDEKCAFYFIFLSPFVIFFFSHFRITATASLRHLVSDTYIHSTTFFGFVSVYFVLIVDIENRRYTFLIRFGYFSFLRVQQHIFFCYFAALCACFAGRRNWSLLKSFKLSNNEKRERQQNKCDDKKVRNIRQFDRYSDD